MEKIKVYISCPMNNRSIKDVEKDIEKYIEYCLINDYEFVNPFEKKVAEDNCSDGVIKDYKPIEMIGKSIIKMQGCTHFHLCGDLGNSKGCYIEKEVARLYGLKEI